jgi:hypothetical protein
MNYGLEMWHPPRMASCIFLLSISDIEVGASTVVSCSSWQCVHTSASLGCVLRRMPLFMIANQSLQRAFLL